MTVERFNEEAINQLSIAYQNDYLSKLDSAMTAYLQWMDENTRGHRFITRFHHFWHGGSGKKRVLKLRKLINNANATFFEIVQRVGEALRESGVTKHSFKRYVFQNMTGITVVNRQPDLPDNNFFVLTVNTTSKEFDDKITQFASHFSPYTLTEGVRAYLKNNKYESLLPHPYSPDFS